MARLLLREQPQGVDVSWAHHAEVAVVKRRELRFVQPLDDCQHRGVHEADVGVGVALAELTNPAVIFGDWVDDAKATSLDVFKERNEHGRPQAPTD